MPDRRVHIVSTGRNCRPWIEKCFASIDAQRYPNVDVVVVDDASTDGSREFTKAWCDERPNWHPIIRDSHAGTAANQWAAIHHLPLGPTDVVVWVDTDDRLAHPGVLDRVVRAYDEGALVTYGSYRAEPASDPSVKTCSPARPYPPEVIRARSYRECAYGPGILFNHLRTVSGGILQQIREDELKDATGRWYQCAVDTAVMMPAMELAGDHVVFIDEVLYIYNCANQASEWRVDPKQVNADHHHQLKVRRPRVEVAL